LTITLAQPLQAEPCAACTWDRIRYQLERRTWHRKRCKLVFPEPLSPLFCRIYGGYSTYIAWALIDAGFPYRAAFGLTLLFSFLAGVAIERIIIQPVERGPALTIVIAFVGLLLILNSLAGWIFSYTIKSFPSPFPSTAWYGSEYLSPHEVGMIVALRPMIAGRVSSI
jgi:hypothetical protein